MAVVAVVVVVIVVVVVVVVLVMVFVVVMDEAVTTAKMAMEKVKNLSFVLQVAMKEDVLEQN